MLALVISVVSIVLAAIAAVVFLYYGGAVFVDPPEEASAKIVNEGQQLLSAVETYYSQHRAWPTKEELLKGNHVTSVTVAGMGGMADAYAARHEWTMPTEARPLFMLRGSISAEACALVNLKGTLGAKAIPRAAVTKLKLQCFGSGQKDSPFRVVAKRFTEADSLNDAHLPAAEVNSGLVPAMSSPLWTLAPGPEAADALKAVGAAVTGEQVVDLGTARTFGIGEPVRVTYRNTTAAAVQLHHIALADAAGEAAFTLSGGTCLDVEVPAGGACTFEAALTPMVTSGGVFQGRLVAHLADGAMQPLPMVLSGMVQVNINPSTAEPVDFGEVRLAQWVGRTVTYRNNTNRTQQVKSIAVTGQRIYGFASSEGFQASGACADGLALLPGAACEFTVGFTPFAVAGAQLGEVVVTTDSGDVKIPGRMQASVLGSTVVGFPGTAEGSRSAPQTLTFTYHGLPDIAAIQVERAVVSLVPLGTDVVTVDKATGAVTRIPAGTEMFEVVTDGCAGKTLTVGQSCAFTARFAPKASPDGYRGLLAAGAGVLVSGPDEFELYGGLELRGQASAR